MTLREEKEFVFDENFNCHPGVTTKDIIHFCNRLKTITGIQTCNHLGMLYEYLPQVYRGALKEVEKNS